MSFREKLTRAAERNRSLLCVGLDPDPARLPDGGVADFLCAVVEATKDLVCAYKPNLAFYEQLGEQGYAALRAVLQAIPDDIPVIADAKRGDVAHTAEAYARALFDELGFDAATVNPYLGGDAVEPFVARADRGVFIVCRTSNPGARDLQDLLVEDAGQARPLYEAVAEMALSWDRHRNVGLVVGATYPEETRRLRALCPELPFLVPGVGAQEGALEEAVRAGLDAAGAGIVVNASRSVLYASPGSDFAQAARQQAEALRAAIEDLRETQPAESRG
ncbi:MAG: orotidine-5'-phosphate decarboxylase [Dehalococcoidia bacterium]